MKRYQEAREYLGLSLFQAAQAAVMNRSDIEAIEAGTREATPGEAMRLSRVYRRPIAWLEGGEEEKVDLGDAADYAETVGKVSLTPHDREQVRRFGAFLRGAGGPPRIDL